MNNISFDVNFDYALSENITISLTANVQLLHSTPHYLVSNFHFDKNPGGAPLLNDINIIATRKKGKISWIHVDSRKETVLSMAIGKAIEARNMVEFGNWSKDSAPLEQAQG
jgi:hypothetical protein